MYVYINNTYACVWVKVLEIKMTPTVTAEGSGDFTREILKQKEVPGYDSQNYRCCRIFAPSNTINSGGGGGEDAVMIPISLVYHKSLLEGREAGGLPRQAPVLMSGYGENCGVDVVSRLFVCVCVYVCAYDL